MKFNSITKLGLFIFLAITLIGSPTFGSDGPQKGLRKIRLGIGYIPNIQNAPIYVAQLNGYYAAVGLDVTVEYGFENDFVALAAQGEREFAVATGDQVILARGGAGLPITYVMKWYQRYPVALIAETSSGILTPKAVMGKTIGLPGFYGATYIGWKALAYAGGIDEKQVTLKQIGFTQVSAIQQKLVDGVMGYIANEPVQLRKIGKQVTVIEVSDYIDLVSNGIVVGDQLMNKEPELVKRMVNATLKGLKFTIENPGKAFTISRKVIPELTDKAAVTQLQVLKTTIALLKTDQLGRSSRSSWQKSVDFLRKTGMLKKDVAVDKLYTNQFIQ